MLPADAQKWSEDKQEKRIATLEEISGYYGLEVPVKSPCVQSTIGSVELRRWDLVGGSQVIGGVPLKVKIMESHLLPLFFSFLLGGEQFSVMQCLPLFLGKSTRRSKS